MEKWMCIEDDGLPKKSGRFLVILQWRIYDDSGCTPENRRFKLSTSSFTKLPSPMGGFWPCDTPPKIESPHSSASSRITHWLPIPEIPEDIKRMKEHVELHD